MRKGKCVVICVLGAMILASLFGCGKQEPPRAASAQQGQTSSTPAESIQARPTAPPSVSSPLTTDNKLTDSERERLDQYNQWGRKLNSNEPEPMRRVLKEMEDSGFSQENVEDFKRLRDQSER